MYIHVSMYATFRKLQRKFLAKNTKIFYKELKKKRKVKSIFEGKFYVQMYAKTNKTKKGIECCQVSGIREKYEKCIARRETETERLMMYVVVNDDDANNDV